MYFYQISNIHTYLRTTELKSIWNQRKEKGNIKEPERLDQMFERLYGKNSAQENGTDSLLQNIRSKLYAGGKLSLKEKEYLRKKDPQTYTNLQQEEQEQKAFEKKLRQCKTKEEAERLKTNRINQSLSAVSAVEHNAAIPKEQKLGIVIRELRRIKKAEEAMQKFVKSGEFAKLPTEAEEAPARKEEAAAKKAEPTPETSQQPAERQALAAEDTSSADTSVYQADTLQETEPKAAQTPIQSASAYRPSKEDYPIDSPELRKVRRARAKAAYSTAAANFAPKQPTPTLNRNA